MKMNQRLIIRSFLEYFIEKEYSLIEESSFYEKFDNKRKFMPWNDFLELLKENMNQDIHDQNTREGIIKDFELNALPAKKYGSNVFNVNIDSKMRLSPPEVVELMNNNLRYSLHFKEKFKLFKSDYAHCYDNYVNVQYVYHHGEIHEIIRLNRSKIKSECKPITQLDLLDYFIDNFKLNDALIFIEKIREYLEITTGGFYEQKQEAGFDANLDLLQNLLGKLENQCEENWFKEKVV